jgi:hypothetical protein
MPHESKVNLGPVLVTKLPSGNSAAGCRCALCEARRATRLAQALHNRYMAMALHLPIRMEEIDEP